MSDETIRQARANIADAKQAEQERIDRALREATASTDAFVAQRDAAQQAAEQAQAQAMAERAQRLEADARAAFQRSYLAAGGDMADFETAYHQHRQEATRHQMQAQQRAARESYRRSF
jgi:hypothetical protein